MAAVVDTHDRVLGTASFPTTQHGYKTMLTWMRSFGELSRVGIECTGTYGAALLCYLQRAGITIMEVTTLDKTVRRKRGKDDAIDAENATHAAYAGIRTVTPKTRVGMIESLRVPEGLPKNCDCGSPCGPPDDPDSSGLGTRGAARSVEEHGANAVASDAGGMASRFERVPGCHDDLPHRLKIPRTPLPGTARRACRFGRHDQGYRR